MANLKISSRIAQLRPTAVNAISAEVREQAARGNSPVSLMRGEPDLPTPAHILAEAQAALARGRTSYPNNQGEPELRAAVSDKLNSHIGVRYSAGDEILVTTGATMGVYAAAAALVDPGAEVLLPEPIYDAYHSVLALAGGKPRSLPAQVVDGRFTLDPRVLSQACRKETVALLLNTPWNPTGTVLRRSELEPIMAIAEQHNLAVISDEIYESAVYSGEHLSPAALSGDARNRTVVVNSFSKTYAMTGWRLGYCAGPATAIRAMYLVLQQSSRGPATFVQDAGVAALTSSQACVESMRLEYASRLQQLRRTLADIPRVRVLVPEAGFFAMLDVRELKRTSDEIRRRLLTEFGVVVMHGSAYGPAGEGTLRVSFASGGDTLSTGLERLRRGLTSL